MKSECEYFMDNLTEEGVLGLMEG